MLVVEDEALILYSISDELRQAGFSVLEARDADEAIALLESNSDIAVVFTDIDMPGSMDGLRLIEVVRDRWPPVRFIVTSGKGTPEAAVVPEGSRFVAKPYSSASVVDAVRGILD